MKRVGILGLPGSGKTTLFEILVQGAGSRSPGAGREQVGVVRVPDERIDRLAALFRPKKVTYAQIQFVDSAAAGGGGRGTGKSADPFASVRLCDALVAVLRDFENASVPIAGGVSPGRDLSTLETELIVNDLGVIENRLERVDKELKVGKKQQNEGERAVLVRCREMLESGQALRTTRFDAEAEKLLRGFQLLTLKPLLVVYNQDEARSALPADPGAGAVAVALRAELEREVVALAVEDRPSFRAELGIVEDGLSVVIQGCYRLLGLNSFFTVGPDEVRAWTVKRGGNAVDAAVEIHTDLARGFIRAEVIGWRELIEAGGSAGAKSKGLLRLEGRDYVVQDGECVEIRFSA